MSSKENKHKYIGAIDLGTTSVRFIVYDLEGKAVSVKQNTLSQQYPQHGWVEESPLEIYLMMEKAVRDTLEKDPRIKDGLVALGICNQRESVMLWDRISGEPLSEV